MSTLTPEELARQAQEAISFLSEVLSSLPEMEWGAPPERTDEEHVRDFAETLRLTREHFDGMPEKTKIHGLYLKGTGTVAAHVGNSPTSANRARILAGLVGNVENIRSRISDAADMLTAQAAEIERMTEDRDSHQRCATAAEAKVAALEGALNKLRDAIKAHRFAQYGDGYPREGDQQADRNLYAALGAKP